MMELGPIENKTFIFSLCCKDDELPANGVQRQTLVVSVSECVCGGGGGRPYRSHTLHLLLGLKTSKENCVT